MKSDGKRAKMFPISGTPFIVLATHRRASGVTTRWAEPTLESFLIFILNMTI